MTAALHARPRAPAATLAPLLLATLASGCAGWSAPERPPAETLVVVVPSRHDGHVGAVVVNEGQKQEVLHGAYESAVTRERSDEIRTATLSADDVSRRFADASAALPPKAVTFTLYFVVRKTELTAESKAQVEAMLTDVASRQAAEIIITGHTDRMGTDERNAALSLKRAQWVRDLVVRKGVAPDLVTTVGAGEREPVVPTADGVPEPKNRRVEILVR